MRDILFQPEPDGYINPGYNDIDNGGSRYEVFSCSDCGAIIFRNDLERHLTWHKERAV